MAGKLKKRLTLAQVLVFFLALLPACYQGVAILKYGVNVPYWDDWNHIRLFQETSQGTLSFGDLIAQMNESRPFFPNLPTIALAFLTDWDVRYEMLVTFLLACLVSFNVYRLGNLTIEGSRLKRLAIFLLANLFIFAPIQAVNWLWGITFIVFVPIACITTGLLVAYSDLGARTKFLTCGVLATISTFSYANGMVAWILLFPVIASSRTWDDSTRKGWLVLAWIMGFAMNAALYFYSYQKPSHHPALSEALAHPVQAVQYFLSFLGAPYSAGLPALVNSAPLALSLAPILGGVLLVLFTWACVYLLRFRRNPVLIHQALGWLMIGAYSIISALVTTFGRLGFGVAQSLSDRYSTFSLYLAVSLIHLIPLVLSDAARESNPLRSRLFTTALGSSLVAFVMFLHLLTSAYWPAERIPIMSLERSSSKACLLLIEVVQDECLTRKVFGNIDFLRNAAKTANNLGFLTPDLVESAKVRDIEGARSRSTDYGHFDGLTKKSEDSYFDAGGWAISPEKERPADGVLLTYEDANGEPTVFAVADTGTERPDVAKSLASDAYTRSGWQESFSPSALPAGSTEIAAWAFDADTKRAFKLHGTYTLEK